MNRVVSYRFFDVVDNIEVKDLRAVNPPSISCQTDAEIKVSMTGRFYYDDVFSDPDLIIRCYQTVNGVTNQLYEFAIGKLLTPTENGTKYADVNGFDFCHVVRRATCETRPFFAKGTLYTVAIEQALAAIGITKIRTEHSALTFAVDREDWERGTNWLVIINVLLSEISYDGLFFGPDGYAIIRKHRDPTFANADHRYEKGEASIIYADCSEGNDLHNAYNVFYAVCDSPDLAAPMVAVAENQNPSSKISIPNRGRIVAPDIKVDGVANQAALQDIADTACRKSMYINTIVEFTTANVVHGVGDIVTLDGSYVTGTVEETGWSLTCDNTDKMAHTARRTDYV